MSTTPDDEAGQPGDQDHRSRQAREFIESMPHIAALNMRIEEMGRGKAVLSLPWAEHLVGDPHSGVIHGGVVSALLDTCCGSAVMVHPTQPRATATLDLRIDYMRAATPGQRITARATCYHVTRSIAFVRAVTVDEDHGKPVATATGTFTIER